MPTSQVEVGGRPATGRLLVTAVTLSLAAPLVVTFWTPALATTEEVLVCAFQGPCGDINGSGTVTAGDALAVLRGAVDLDQTLTCLCEDTTPVLLTTGRSGLEAPVGSGEDPVCGFVGQCGDVNWSWKVTAGDALAVLRTAVHLAQDLTCVCEQTTAVEFGVHGPIAGTRGSGLAVIELRAKFPQLLDQDQAWEMVSMSPVGVLESHEGGATYSAGSNPGKDVVQVTSSAAAGLSRQQTVTVLEPFKTTFLLYNANGDSVSNGGTPPQFIVGAGVPLAQVVTYHYNEGNGSAEPGTIALRRVSDHRVWGPWDSTGSGSEVAPNLNWVVNLGGLVLPAGTYEVIDSEPSTWAANEGTAGTGMSWILRWNP